MLYEKIRKIFFKGMKLQLSVEVKDTFHYLHEIKIKNKKKGFSFCQESFTCLYRIESTMKKKILQQ